jgi:hypothetical protein
VVYRRFGKIPSPYYGKNSSNKQRETTVNISITFIVSSSAVAKTIKRSGDTEWKTQSYLFFGGYIH